MQLHSCRSFALIVALASVLMPPVSAFEIIGHRGASYDAPENTLSSFKPSFSQGADAAELDIHLTRDQKIAVLHDYDLQRIAGLPAKVAKQNSPSCKNKERGSVPGRFRVLTSASPVCLSLSLFLKILSKKTFLTITLL